jgi:hypothetical protein
MTLEELIKLIENRLADTANKKVLAISIGDIEQLSKLEKDEHSTSTLLSQLKQVQNAAI